MEPTEFIEKIMHGKCFYHFTDTRNMPSIKQHGLMSLRLLREKGIAPPAPGGNAWSHDADARVGMDGYVHLCLLEEHPMEHMAKKDGRIATSVFIKVANSILHLPGVKFAAGVANKRGVETLDLKDDLAALDFKVIYERTDWNDPEIQARRSAAKKYEVLVPNHVPLEYLSGI